MTFMKEHRAHRVEHERVGRIAKGYARGGSVHSDEAEDKALIKKEVKPSALKADGKKPKARADKVGRAKGGRVKKGAKTNVNVIVAPGHSPPQMAGAGPSPLPTPAAPPPLAPPPRPGGGANIPMRKKGGRIQHHDKSDVVRRFKGKIESTPHRQKHGVNDMPARAKGGMVGKKSLADSMGVTGIGKRTPIQHSGNKSDTQNIGRKAVITKATGGPIYSDGKWKEDMGPNLNAGANSGVGRMRKNHLAKAEGWEA